MTPLRSKGRLSQTECAVELASRKPSDVCAKGSHGPGGGQLLIGKGNFTALVGAAMCSAILCGTHDRGALRGSSADRSARRPWPRLCTHQAAGRPMSAHPLPATGSGRLPRSLKGQIRTHAAQQTGSITFVWSKFGKSSVLADLDDH